MKGTEALENSEIAYWSAGRLIDVRLFPGKDHVRFRQILKAGPSGIAHRMPNSIAYHGYFFWRWKDSGSTGGVTRAIKNHSATSRKYGKGITHIFGFSSEVFGNLRKIVKNVFARNFS